MHPEFPILLGVLAIAQMGVHLVFFLHISSAPDQTNNVLALAFGVFRRRADRVRLADHHGQSESRHDADAAPDADAALTKNSSYEQESR